MWHQRQLLVSEDGGLSFFARLWLGQTLSDRLGGCTTLDGISYCFTRAIGSPKLLTSTDHFPFEVEVCLVIHAKGIDEHLHVRLSEVSLVEWQEILLFKFDSRLTQGRNTHEPCRTCQILITGAASFFGLFFFLAVNGYFEVKVLQEGDLDVIVIRPNVSFGIGEDQLHLIRTFMLVSNETLVDRDVVAASIVGDELIATSI